jgi:hypothetical protein
MPDITKSLQLFAAALTCIVIVVVTIAILIRVVPAIAGDEPNDCRHNQGVARLVDANDDDNAKAVCGDGRIVSLAE